MTQQLFFAFDLDGVLVDTIETLYSAYLGILKRFEAIGTPAEFDYLNGKNLREIATHLRIAHQLSCDEAELASLFQEKFDNLYSDVDLIPGAQSILEFLKSQGARIALASSSSHRNIDVILQRFELSHFFELVVSGDSFERAKPSPDIYDAVKHHFGTNRCFVVEDSMNGIQAARRAGLFTLLFNPGIKQRNASASLTIHGLHEIEAIVANRASEPILIAKCANIELRTLQDVQTLSDNAFSTADEIWRSELEKRPSLFNGPILSYSTHHVNEEDTLVVASFASQYKYFLARGQDSELESVHPLAVSGVVVDANQKILIAKRTDDVTEYPGHYEFVPSGGISGEDSNGEGYRQQLLVELEEETGIHPSNVETISSLGLIYDPLHGVYDIALLAKLGIEIDPRNLKSTEYSSFSLHDVSSLKSLLEELDFVPTSRAIYSALPDTEVV